MQSHIVTSDGEKTVTIYRTGKAPLLTDDQHPNWDAIMAAIDADQEDGIEDLFDASLAIGKRFARLSRRVTAGNGRLYLDGDEVANTLTAQVLRFLDEGVEDWKPLVAYFEKVQANPSQNSREQLYSFIDRHGITITAEGDLVFYKGVERAEDGYRSIRSGGTVLVDGAPVSGQVPNNPGSVVTMPRRDVADAPHVGCSTGLHVGSFNYAKGWGHGLVLEVHVDPADVVSVPVDSEYQKVRTCRYRIEDVIEVEYTEPVLFGLTDWDDDEDYDEWDEGIDPENEDEDDPDAILTVETQPPAQDAASRPTITTATLNKAALAAFQRLPKFPL